MKIIHDKNVRLTRKRKILMMAADFYIHYLGLDVYEDVVLCLCFKHGFIDVFSTYAQVEHVSQNRLNIELDAHLPSSIALQILAHELVHVGQYVSGRLSQTEDGYQLWEGELVAENLAYIDEPWEREAMEKQIVMQYAYIAFRDGTK